MPRVRVLMDTRRGERTFAARPASASPLPPAGRRATRGGATRRRCGAARWSSSSRSRQSPRRARPSSCRTRSIGSSRSGGRASSPPARGKPVGVGGRVVKRSVAPTHLLHRLVGRRKGEVGIRVRRRREHAEPVGRLQRRRHRVHLVGGLRLADRRARLGRALLRTTPRKASPAAACNSVRSPLCA